MSKPVILTEPQWYRLYEQLKQDNPKSVMLIRDRMKDTLGFTQREHRWYTLKDGWQQDIRLDFYNEPKRTMFLLKYSEFLEKTNH